MSSSIENIKIRNDRPAGTIVIHRPGQGNALNRELTRQLIQSFKDLLMESSVKAVVLTGSGDVFCAGSDLRQLQETSEQETPFESWQSDSEDYVELIQLMLTYPKPIIAAVNGPAVGLGAALFLAADIVIASENASLWMPEARLGLSSGLTAPLLAFRANPGIASNIILSGSKVPAPQAIQFGLFHELVPFDLLWAKAFEMATQCALGARESHQMNKRMLNETLVENLMTQVSIGASEMAAARASRASQEGIAAFLDKRDPDWDSLYNEMG